MNEGQSKENKEEYSSKLRLNLDYDLEIPSEYETSNDYRFSDIIDYNLETSKRVYFNGSSKRVTFVEKFEGENYLFRLEKKVEEQFGILDNLMGNDSRFRLDNSFKHKIKQIIINLYKITKKNPKYFQWLHKKEETRCNISIKYLFLSVVYLKLRNDLYEQMSDFLFEVGINDLIEAYGAKGICEISQRSLGRYISFVKAIFRDFDFKIKTSFSFGQRKKLTFSFLDYYLNVFDKRIRADPNYFNFSEKKFKRVLQKLWNNFDSKEFCLKTRKIRDLACAFFQVGLRLLDINFSLLDITKELAKEAPFSNLLYYSVSRIIRDICGEFFEKFYSLMKFYKTNKHLVIKKFGKLCWFLKMHEENIESVITIKRNNIRTITVNEVVKFMLKKKVINFFKERVPYKKEGKHESSVMNDHIYNETISTNGTKASQS